VSKDVASGMGVDKSGGPVIDPTANVIALTEAANTRQDDLRLVTRELFDAKLETVKVQVQSVEKEMLLRSEHTKEVRLLNSMFLEKTREVDSLAAFTAAQRQLTAVETLARQGTEERETLRSLVESKAQTLASQTAEKATQQDNRIAQLERTSYEGAGKGVGTTKLIGFIFGGCSLAIAAGGFILGFLVVLAGIIVYAVRAGG
jgi:hypothetical protein